MIKKKLLITLSGVLLWGLIGGGIWYSLQLSNLNNFKTVLGVNDSKITEPIPSSDLSKKEIIKNNIPSIKLNSAPVTSTANVDQPDLLLVGNGCNQDSKFGTSCVIQSSASLGLTLKSCKEEYLTRCNFYSFGLGRRVENTQYIIQKYEENGDILVDILSYLIDQNTISTTKTVLFQSVNDGSIEAKNGNNEYLAILSQYQ
jgi:hypothetical protein